MTLEAGVGKDRPDLPVEIDRELVGHRFASREKQ
jgi:hypothetical protein